jgi:hypothetical protein
MAHILHIFRDFMINSFQKLLIVLHLGAQRPRDALSKHATILTITEISERVVKTVHNM